MDPASGWSALRGKANLGGSGLAVLFVVFYIFNLQYQDEASKTLEFI